MTRLINAYALIDMLRTSKHMIYNANATLEIIQNNEIERCISFVETAPTVEERPHGEWFGTVCTNCGESTSFYYDCNYCPQCGADMRVKDELNRVSKELNSKTEYKAKVKELENAIAKCEKAEEEFKKRTCKFKSRTNCDFCSFHSDCDEHWKEGEAE